MPMPSGPLTAAEAITHALKERGISPNGLARLLAEDELGHDGQIPHKVFEKWRQAIYRWTKKGTQIEEKNAAAIERVLDLPPGTIPRFDRRAGASLDDRLADLEAHLRLLSTTVDSHSDSIEKLTVALEALGQEPGEVRPLGGGTDK